jgi:hypothetical protein
MFFEKCIETMPNFADRILKLIFSSDEGEYTNRTTSDCCGHDVRVANASGSSGNLAGEGV